VDCCVVVQYEKTMWVEICPVPNGKYSEIIMVYINE